MIKTSQLETKSIQYSDLARNTGMIDAGKERVDGGAGLRASGDDGRMKMTAATSAVVNETQIVGEGSNVSMFGTR